MACRSLVVSLLIAASVFLAGVTPAQTNGTVVPSQPYWSQLNAAQRTALTPLAKEWNRFPDDQKLKWLGIARRYRNMKPEEQARLQQRMRDWVALSPIEREKARDQYRRLRTAPAEERKRLAEKWQEYEALPQEEKQRLQASVRPAGKPAAGGLGNTASGPVAVPRTAPRVLNMAPIAGHTPGVTAAASAPR